MERYVRGPETTVERIADRVIARMAAAGMAGATTGKMGVTGESATVPTPTLDEPPPILLSTKMAAKLLGCSVKAIYHRVSERQIPSSCIVRSGRRLLFHRERFFAAMERKAGK